MKKTIFIAVILCAALLLPSLLTQNTVYADQQNEETVVSKGNDSYLSVSLLDLLSEEKLTPDETMKETNLSTPEEGNGVLIRKPSSF